MEGHSHPFWTFLSSAVLRSVLAGVLFVGMMIWTAWMLLASVWAEAERPDSEPGDKPVSWQGKKDIAGGPAYQGSWRMNDSDFRFVDDPSVDVGEDGSIALVWVDQSDKNVFFQLLEETNRMHPEEPVNVSSSPDIFSWLPRVVISPVNRDHIFVLWQEIIFSGGSHGGEILFSRSIDRGQSFSEPLNLSNTPAGAGKGRLTFQRWDNGSLDLAVDREGTIYATWTEYEGSLQISRSIDDGKSFSEPVTVAGDDDSPARGPSIAITSDDIIHMVWAVGEDRAGDIHYTHSTGNGPGTQPLQFESPQVVTKTGGHSEAPRIAGDSQGNLHLVYAESSDGPFQRYHVYYSQLNTKDKRNIGDARQDDYQRNSSDSIEKPEGRRTESDPNRENILSTEPIRISEPHPGPIESANFPELKLDDEDHIYVIWELFPDFWNRPRGLGFSASFDNGRTFTEPLQVPHTGDPAEGHNGSRQGLLMNKLAVSPSGAISVVNSTFLEGESSNIRLIRGQADPE